MGRASQEAGPTKQYASNRSSSPSPKSSPGFISPGSMLNPHMLFGHPTRDGRASQKEAGEKTRKGRRRNAGDRSGEDNTVRGVRLPLTRTKNPSPCPAHTDAWPCPLSPPSSAGQALTRIWFRSCSASCLSCSSSLMAPGPWGGVGGGWGPRDGGWGRQLLAAGPRPGGCRADVRPKVAGKKGGKAGLKRGRKG